mmetsp:Transcript_48720/g.95542  ORF Transcript_48720/g.95542 Transcript_48720/m.95542 type:complete len:227 (+) Transcript_48720:213-893(+)
MDEVGVIFSARRGVLFVEAGKRTSKKQLLLLMLLLPLPFFLFRLVLFESAAVLAVVATFAVFAIIAVTAIIQRLSKTEVRLALGGKGRADQATGCGLCLVIQGCLRLHRHCCVQSGRRAGGGCHSTPGWGRAPIGAGQDRTAQHFNIDTRHRFELDFGQFQQPVVFLESVDPSAFSSSFSVSPVATGGAAAVHSCKQPGTVVGEAGELCRVAVHASRAFLRHSQPC